MRVRIEEQNTIIRKSAACSRTAISSGRRRICLPRERVPRAVPAARRERRRRETETPLRRSAPGSRRSGSTRHSASPSQAGRRRTPARKTLAASAEGTPMGGAVFGPVDTRSRSAGRHLSAGVSDREWPEHSYASPHRAGSRYTGQRPPVPRCMQLAQASSCRSAGTAGAGTARRRRGSAADRGG